MRTKILIMMLCAVQLVSAQLGDQLLEKQISQSNNEYQPEKVRVFGKCEGACFSDAIFNPSINSTNFKVSHGSPTFSANSVWMWSYKGSRSIRGEGVFTGFKFVKGRQYCIEVDVELSRSTNATIDPGATFNFDATNTVTAGGTSSGGGNLPSITPRQSLISGNYSTGTYPFNSTFKIRKTVTINDNYNQLWIYPKNPGKPHPQLNMRVSNIVIKEVIDCPCQIKGAIKYKVGPNCQFQFAGNATAGSGTTITGYLWNFGDGTTSTQQNPTHAYTQQGSYVVTLTVLGINKEGECCTQVFKTKVRVKGECHQECEINASFKVIRKGSWFWRSYNFMNTSSSNAFTTIMGYAWYVDGVLVSTNKDFVNYRGRGKRVCLKVYGIDKKGNCCQEEYCYTLRK